MHCTASATTVALWDWDQPHVSLLSEPLSSTGFDPRTFRSLGEISTATAAWVPGIQVLVPYIYLSDSSEGASNIKRNLQDSNPGRGHGKAGPYLPGHWRLGFNVGIPGPVPVNRTNQNLRRKQPGWRAKLSMSWNKMEILIHPTFESGQTSLEDTNTEAALYNGSRHLWYTGCRTVNKVPLTATINTRTSKMF